MEEIYKNLFKLEKLGYTFCFQVQKNWINLSIGRKQISGEPVIFAANLAIELTKLEGIKSEQDGEDEDGEDFL